jgi:SAM-dependent methyltransferase
VLDLLRPLKTRLARSFRFSLRSGERQTGATLAAIRADHRQRYELAASRLADALAGGPRPLGLDAFCGNGYGTRVLADELGGAVIGVDGSAAAIEHARRHHASAATTFAVLRFPAPLPRRAFDYAVCFESLEHVDDDRGLLAALAGALRPGGWLWLSAPDEERLPLAQHPNPFHVRHYRPEVVIDHLARPLGLEPITWFGQDGYKRDARGRLQPRPAHLSRPREALPGQTRIYVFRAR